MNVSRFLTSGALGIRVILCVAASAGWAKQVGAQGAVFRGRVTTATDAAIASVEVVIADIGRTAMTDTSGRFVFRGIPAGRYAVTLRRPAFRPITGTARFADGDSLDMRFRMEALSTLDSVRVTELARGSMAEFERRRAAGYGVFIRQDMLERRESSHLSEIVKSQAGGVELVRLGDAGVAAAGTHAGHIPCGTLRPCESPKPWPDKCYMQVFVDGTLQYAYTTANSSQPFDLDGLSPGGLAGIEIYRGAAETPPEFNGTGSACGTIAIWTRSGRAR
ncbi:MAG: carboxypeptidase-like regulatory domain-containing protein [Gemmatimonadota bacterium]|nr:carboxypeptidase-like regulatory domain-containing protein [Gemmatimonadota bacterium]